MSANGATKLIEVRDLVKHFPLRQGIILQKQVGAVHAVDGISFDVFEGETLGLVGESGCGKSTTARLLTRLLEPTGGAIIFKGNDIAHSSRAALKPLRRDMQMIFQDPYSSLNPRKTVGSIIGEPFIIHELETRRRQAQEARAGADGPRRAQPRALQPLPARVLRRPAPAHRRRARDRAEAEADRRRRAGLGARRLDPGADHQPAARAPARARADDHLHRPRPLGRAPHVRPRRGDVPGQDRRAGRRRPALRPPAPSRTRARCCRRCPVPDPRLAREKQRQVLGGDVPVADQPAAGVPLPHALPEGARRRAATSTSRCSRSRRAATSPPATSR